MTALLIQPPRVFQVSQPGQPVRALEAAAIMPLALALSRLSRERQFVVPHGQDQVPEMEAASQAWSCGRAVFGPLLIEESA